MRRVAILTHASHDSQMPYFLREIARVWTDAGIDVALHSGLGTPPPGDLAILHVDLSIVPAEYLELARSYERVLNVAVTDITKVAISRQLVRRGDGYDGPVLVKTNLNYGGIQELKLRKSELRRADANRLLDYRVYRSPSAVPAATWDDETWIVERFLPEIRDRHFCLRTWMFLGDHETNSISYSRSPIVKSGNVVRREVVLEVPEALRARRRELGVDYGKFDYALHGGEVVLYDVNKTPSMGHFVTEKLQASVLELSRGLAHYGIQ